MSGLTQNLLVLEDPPKELSLRKASLTSRVGNVPHTFELQTKALLSAGPSRDMRSQAILSPFSSVHFKGQGSQP